MAIANKLKKTQLIIFTFKELCNGEQWLAAQHLFIDDYSDTFYNIKFNPIFSNFSAQISNILCIHINEGDNKTKLSA